MKIRKKTSFMLLAASTAAVVGVAAVSFAAWQGSGINNLAASASTGVIEVIGFNITGTAYVQDTTDTNKATLSLNDKLVPYNQGTVTTNLPEGTVDYYNIAIPKVEYNASYEIKVKYTLTDAAGNALTTDNTFVGSLKYKYDTTALTAAPTDISGWTAFTTSATAVEGYTPGTTVGGATDTADGGYLQVVLVSDSNQDMNKNFKITIELVPVEAQG